MGTWLCVAGTYVFYHLKFGSSMKNMHEVFFGKVYDDYMSGIAKINWSSQADKLSRSSWN